MTPALPLLLLALGQGPSPCLERVPAIADWCATAGAAGCPDDEPRACRFLALQFTSSTGKRSAAPATPSASLLPRATAGANATPSQVDAAPSVRTVGLAGAALGEGSAPGDPLVVTLRLNPFGVSSWDEASFARWARLADVAVVLPASFGEGTVADFAGLRFNVNVAAFRSGAYAALAEEVQAAYVGLWTAVGTQADLVSEKLLALGPAARRACLDALFRQPPATPRDLEAACGLGLGPELQKAEARARDAVRAFRETVDREHAGLAVSIDTPLSKTSAHPFRGSAALVGELSTPPAGRWTWGLRLALAGDLQSQAGTTDGGGSLAASGHLSGAIAEGFPFAVSFGAKGHVGGTYDPSLFAPNENQGRFLNLQAGLRAPLGASGFALSAGVTWPVAGDGAGPPVVTTAIDYAVVGDAAAGP